MGGDYFGPPKTQSSNNFNPRLHYGRRLKAAKNVAGNIAISIHASTMGGDPGFSKENAKRRNFNPRLHYGRRLWQKVECYRGWKFQSTPPLWEATISRFSILIKHFNFNPRLHYGRRPFICLISSSNTDFNPRLHYGRRLGQKC